MNPQQHLFAAFPLQLPPVMPGFGALIHACPHCNERLPQPLKLSPGAWMLVAHSTGPETHGLMAYRITDEHGYYVN